MAAPAHLVEGWSPPLKAQYVLALVVVGENGNAAVVYGAQDQASRTRCMFATSGLGRWLRTPSLPSRRGSKSLRAECRTSSSAIWCAETMLLFARSAGVDAHPIPSDFRVEDRLLSVAGHVASGAVRITGTVTEKAKTSPFAGALNLQSRRRNRRPAAVRLGKRHRALVRRRET